MIKPYWNILISILINLGCSQNVTAEDNETLYYKLNETLYEELNGTFYNELNETFYDEYNDTFYAELNKPSENLTMMGYEIVHLNDRNTEVRNTPER